VNNIYLDSLNHLIILVLQEIGCYCSGLCILSDIFKCNLYTYFEFFDFKICKYTLNFSLLYLHCAFSTTQARINISKSFSCMEVCVFFLFVLRCTCLCVWFWLTSYRVIEAFVCLGTVQISGCKWIYTLLNCVCIVLLRGSKFDTLDYVSIQITHTYLTYTFVTCV
jgi:hypothetical protein